MNIKKIALVISLFSLAGLSAVGMDANAGNEVLLQGAVTKTTCSVGVNGGKSTLNVGSYQSSEFSAPNKKVGSVPLPVSLTGCSAEEQGRLVVQGLTSSSSVNQTIFVSNPQDTVGFVVSEAGGTTPISNGNGPTVVMPKDGTSQQYAFNVGMTSAIQAAKIGAYSAPIVISYIVN